MLNRQMERWTNERKDDILNLLITTGLMIFKNLQIFLLALSKFQRALWLNPFCKSYVL